MSSDGVSSTRRRLIAIVAIVAAIAVPGWLLFRDETNRAPIKVGILHSLTGTMSASESPVVDGCLLAIEQINAAGGVLGKQLEIISRDDQGKPGVAVKLAEELFVKEGVALVSGSLFSHIGLALTSYAGQKKRLYVAAEPLADSLVWDQGNRW